MTTDTSSKDLNICVLGIDPGLVHTGVVELYFNFSAILLSIRSQVFLPTEIPSIPNWRTQPPTGVVFIEAYQPRSHFATDTRMLELIQQLRQLLPDAKVIKNTAVKKLVPASLLYMLQLYDFSQASHHQDLRSAARIALLGMMKDPDLNMRLSKMFYEALTFDPNWTIQKLP